MKFEFTDAQKSALAVGDYSLLVAAGAGSGKTRVLIERVVRRLLKAGDGKTTDITRFLIVTFTKAATGELCERIRKALTDALENAPDEAARNAAVKNLALLPQAKVCTIDSFCYDFVRDHAELLNLPSKLRIADKVEEEVLLDGIIDALIEEKMAECAENQRAGKDDYFLTVYDMFSAPRSDSGFVDTLKALYDVLLKRPSPRKFLENAAKLYREPATAQELFDTVYGNGLRLLTGERLSAALATCEDALRVCEEDEELEKKIAPTLENDIEILKNLTSSLNAGYKATAEYMAVAAPSFKRSPSVKKLESPYAELLVERRKSAVDSIKALNKDYFSVSPELFRLCAEDCLHVTEVLKQLLLQIDERLWEVKRSHGILSFADLERLTLKLLYDDEQAEKPSALAEETAKLFDELYIDEYQDIDPIQDRIFLAISRKNSDGTECGRFMVGDAKQSIYRFRGATPEIFLNYRDTFSPCDAEGEPRRRVFMSENFRCSPSVIDFTNAVFEKVFENYDKNESLICSRAGKEALKEPVHLIYCNTDALPSAVQEDRRRAEAEVVYREILSILNDPEACDESGRHYTLSDMAILTAKWDAAKFLERYLTERSLSVSCDKGESFFDRREIRLAFAVLETADNPQKDIPLAGVLRSPIGGFDDNELVKIRRKAKDKPLYEALCSFAQNESETPLKAKCARFLALLEELRSAARGCGASEFLRKMYALTDLPAICAAGDTALFGKLSPESRKKNLMLLYDKARAFDSTVFRGISAFLNYMNDIKASDDGLKSCSDAFGGIRIMTVHHSKGLEFPICFLFNIDRECSKNKASCLLSDAYGMTFPLKGYADIRTVAGNDGFVTVETPFRRLASDESDAGEIEEFKRLLYVALTRARDRLYMTASPAPKKPKKDEEATGMERILRAAADPEAFLADGTTFLDWILGYAAAQKPFETLASHPDTAQTVPFADEHGNIFFDIRTVLCQEEQALEKVPEKAGNAPQTPHFEVDAALLEKIRASVSARKARLDALCAVPPKLTVSLLKEGLIDYEDAPIAAAGERKLLEIPDFVRESDEKTAVERGTAMHVFMQFANFAACEEHGAKAEAARLADEGFLTETQKNLLDFTRLDGFFRTPLYQKIRSARKVYRELRFNLRLPAEEVLKGIPQTDDFVLVQGVIDCFIEGADGSYSVIDFKTDRVKRDGGEALLAERYSNQLALYARAVVDMTKAPVKSVSIFSFHLMKEIPLDADALVFGKI